VLIGDHGMSADGTGLHVMDLGLEWLTLTGKPFLWAAWIGEDGLIPELAAHLSIALENAGPLEHLVQVSTDRTSIPADAVRDYFAHVMEYRMSDDMLAGLREFQRRLLANGFDDCTHFPRLVSPSSVAAGL
jgi:chorismate dehydratase